MNKGLFTVVLCMCIMVGVTVIPGFVLLAQSEKEDPAVALEATAPKVAIEGAEATAPEAAIEGVEITTPDVTIEGAIQEIAADKSYIIVDGTKIITESDFFGYNDLAVGKTVAIFAEKTDNGLIAVDCVPINVDATAAQVDINKDSSKGMAKDY